KIAWEQQIENNSFEDFLTQCSSAVANNEIIWNNIGTKCRKCSFVADSLEVEEGKKSDFMLKTPGNFTDNDFKKPMSWEIWDERNKNKWLSERKYFVDQFTLEDLEPKNKSTRVSRGLSRLERHDEQRIKLLRMITLHTSTKLHFGYIFQNWNILYTA